MTNTIRLPSWICFIPYLQLILLLFYFIQNVISVGGFGTASSFLAVFLCLSFTFVFAVNLRNYLYIKPHFMLFVIFILWVSLKVVIDTGDTYVLRQVTIATTGGILFFYMLGTFLGITYYGALVPKGRLIFVKLSMFFFILMILWMLYNFGQRLRDDIFYLTDIDGAYQRSGNFLSMSFMINSFLFLLVVLKHRIINRRSTFWYFLYGLSAVLSIVGAQLFGSNNATVVIVGLLSITVITALTVTSSKFYRRYLAGAISLPLSKTFTSRLFTYTALIIFTFAIFIGCIVFLTDFDFSRIRLFGFGSSSSSSLLSRVEILLQSGIEQLSYAPLYGNMNVAYIITGDSGRFIHSFFLFVIANLGLIGFFIVLLVFSSVFVQLYKSSKLLTDDGFLSFEIGALSVYSLFVFTFLLLFANITTDVSWSVLWFTLGLISKPIGFNK